VDLDKEIGMSFIRYYIQLLMKYDLKIKSMINIHEAPIEQKIAYTECHGRAVNTPALYSEGPGFKS
jgi:hypothetical protein